MTSSISAFSAEGPCNGVASVLDQSGYFKNTDHNGNILGYVELGDSPAGRYMLFDDLSNSTVVAKSTPDLLVGQVGIKASGGKCVFFVGIPIRGLLGHEVIAKDGKAIEFLVAEDDHDVFFKSSLLVPVTEAGELAEVSKRFKE